MWSGRRTASPSPSPLRTVLESCPSYGSSRPLPSVLPEALSRMGRCVALGSVCRPVAGSHLTCPFSLHNPPGSCRVVHPAHVSGLSAQAMRPYPPGYGFPLPFSRRRSLLGPSCARWGFGLPCGRLTGRRTPARPQRGCHVPHGREPTGEGALSTAGTRCPSVSLRGEHALPPAEGPATWSHHRRFSLCDDLFVTQPQTRVHSHSPVRSSLHPAATSGLQPSWALPSASDPTVASDAREGQGWAWTLAQKSFSLVLCGFVSHPST